VRAVLYCRVSTVEQASNLSLPTQEAMCREYCEREGYDVDRVFVDAGESARTANRPEFQRLLTYCREQKRALHAVVVHSLTRFSRNTADHHAIAALLRGMGISLRSATEPIDDSPAGRFVEGVLSAAAQFDNDVRSSRIREGMRASRQRGRWINRAPIGYLNAARLKDGPSLVMDPVRGPLVRQAFELVASAHSLREIRHRLTTLGLTTPQSGQPLARVTLFRLLRKRVYAGWLKSGDTAERGDWAPLITDDLYDEAQQHLRHIGGSRLGRHRRLEHPDFPLRRFVRCGTCDRPFTGSWTTGRGGKRHAYYHCIGGCMRPKKTGLEDAWLALLERVRPSPGYLRVLRQLVLDGWEETLKQSRSARLSIQARLTTIEQRLCRLDEAWLYERSIDEATYIDQRDRQREALALARIELSDAQIDEIDVQGAIDYAEHVLTDGSRLWTDATPEGRWHLQWGLFPKGLTWDGETFGTVVTSLAFYQLQPPGAQNDAWYTD